MRCETWDGAGMVLGVSAVGPRKMIVSVAVPCPDCGGCGVAHCCDGLTAVNETPEPEPTAE
jgi:DnaJ-class molecular chaperone